MCVYVHVHMGTTTHINYQYASHIGIVYQQINIFQEKRYDLASAAHGVDPEEPRKDGGVRPGCAAPQHLGSADLGVRI